MDELVLIFTLLGANAQPIGFLSVGLVLATNLAVTVVGHALGLPWAAFVLAATVSPPRSLRARQSFHRRSRICNSSRQVVTLPVLFLTYILAEEGPREVRHELLGFAGEPYFSGVLAVVTAGLVVGRKSSVVMNWSSTVGGPRGLGRRGVFAQRAFVLIGLQLPEITGGLGGHSAADLMRSGVLVSLIIAFTRIFGCSRRPTCPAT